MRNEEPPGLWTIGHSTRPIEELLKLLETHGVRLLIDVRTTHYSRHNPQFNSDRLADSLVKAGLQYKHLPTLGGRRKSRFRRFCQWEQGRSTV